MRTYPEQIGEIHPGLYVLMMDVKNPSPDRRVQRDWTKEPVWKRGTKFVVYFQWIDEDLWLPTIALVGDRFQGLHTVYRTKRSTSFELLYAAFAPYDAPRTEWTMGDWEADFRARRGVSAPGQGSVLQYVFSQPMFRAVWDRVLDATDGWEDE